MAFLQALIGCLLSLLRIPERDEMDGKRQGSVLHPHVHQSGCILQWLGSHRSVRRWLLNADSSLWPRVGELASNGNTSRERGRQQGVLGVGGIGGIGQSHGISSALPNGRQAESREKSMHAQASPNRAMTESMGQQIELGGQGNYRTKLLEHGEANM